MNRSVELARIRRIRELRLREAEVATINWDPAQGKGIDDLLANMGPTFAIRMLERADFDTTESGTEITVPQLAEVITDRYYFARDEGGHLYYWKNGVYQPDGSTFVKERVKLTFQRLKLTPRWTSRWAKETIEYIRADAPTLWEKPPLDRINVLNGILNVNVGMLEPHSPRFLSTVQLPVKFDPAACCPHWEKFVCDVFPDDAEQLAWEIMAWLMRPDLSIQKAILLVGEGENGKSAFLRGLTSFLGKRNISALSLHRLEEDRFAVARLLGKLANVGPDLPSQALSNTSIFKALTGGDNVAGERKYEQVFEFIPFARLVFSANHLPRSLDASSAFFRRWLVIPFSRTFTEDDPKTLPQDELGALLADPQELSGVLNKALEVLPSLRDYGFTKTESIREAQEEFRKTTDPLAVWLDAHTMPNPDAFVVIDELWTSYRADCIIHERSIMTKNAFGRAFAQLRPAAKKLQRPINSKYSWCYVGIALVSRTDGEESK